jgi:CBS-domain-containing membrane protein
LNPTNLYIDTPGQIAYTPIKKRLHELRIFTMKTITVKDLMVPLDEYATVRDDASLYEAVKALEKAQEKLDRERYPYLHRAILVFDKNKQIVGKISQLDVLKALEPRYSEMGDLSVISRAGLSVEFIKSIMSRYDLYQKTFSEMCMTASELRVKDIMYTPGSDEYVEENDSLGNAIHRLIMGHHQSLLVTRDKEIVGILRLTDVFHEVFQRMESKESE